MKRWRRPLILIALLLLVGAVVNVAVAWDSANRRLPKAGAYGSAICGDPTGSGGIISWAAANGVRGDRRIWRTEYLGEYYGPITFSLGTEWRHQRERPADDFKGQWGSLFSGPGRTVQPIAPHGTEEAHGWPFRCLWGAMVWDGGSHPQRPVRAIALAESDGWLRDAHYLPLRPLFPGFAINTLFYAVVVGAILALPLSFFPIRRRLRARRGRCPKCGYDLAGLGGAACPECAGRRDTVVSDRGDGA